MEKLTRLPSAAIAFLAVAAIALTLSWPASDACAASSPSSRAGGPTPDAAAVKAFGRVLESYRSRSALRIKCTLKIELFQGESAGKSEEVTAEFIYTRTKKGESAGVAKIKDFNCYFHDGVFTAVHTKTDHSYYREEYEGSPYWSLFGSFQDMPYPHLAILWGEEEESDVWMQLEMATPLIVPTEVSEVIVKEKKRQKIVFSGDDGELRMIVDPKTRFIDSIEHEITGGSYVQPGSRKLTTYTYEYTIPEKPLPRDELFFDPGERQRVDLLAALMPAPAAPPPGAGPDAGGGGHGGALVGQLAPAITLATSTNDAVDLEDLRGKVVVIDFWATWCPPCKKALPLLHDVAEWARTEQLPVEVLTVNVWEAKRPEDNTPDGRLDSVRAFWTKHGYTLPVLMDFTDEVAAAYGLTGIPATFVLRSDGVVHTQHAGMSRTYVDDLKRDIRDALAALEAPAP